MKGKEVLIIGAGPAGLTAAYELTQRSDIKPIVIEKLNMVGGLSRTINFKGNRIDIGGHRFFSKSDKVLDWWLKILPLEAATKDPVEISYQRKSKTFLRENDTPSGADDTMLLRNRHSRIYFLKHLFRYPIDLDLSTLRKLGVARSCKILISYVFSKFSPVRPETSLEDFLINHFGKVLYKTFFKDYTIKVWGVDPQIISAEWGRQRIKGVSVSKIISNAFKKKGADDIYQKNIETSLIEKFLYPKYGPGHLWEKVADEILKAGGEILLEKEVIKLHVEDNQVKAIEIKNCITNEIRSLTGDYFISTMPMQELTNALDPVPEKQICEIANGLGYREFITVGLLVKDLELKESSGKIIRDNWIYVQEQGVKIARLQIFNNWSPYMVNDSANVWLGLEYFCQKDDWLWSRTDEELLTLAERELIQIGIIKSNAVLDGTVVRVEKAYPSYFGSYDKIDSLRRYLDGFRNLFLIGRNGMHRYNNQDHSMLTAMEAVTKILSGNPDKSSLWAINTEDLYHEET